MRARVAEPPPEVRESRLLDRHGEPGDQPRDLIQMPGIMRFNGLGEPKQAFVVAHGGNVAWDDRRFCVEVGHNGWRRTSSHETRQTKPFGRLSRISGPSITPVYDGIAQPWVPAAVSPRERKRRQIVVAQGLSDPASPQRTAGDLVLCKPERLCYTLPAREPLFRLFLGSSAVEHSTVNRMVAGSNPARGAKLNQLLREKSGHLSGAVFLRAHARGIFGSNIPDCKKDLSSRDFIFQMWKGS
jgi:hypothetical protein